MPAPPASIPVPAVSDPPTRLSPPPVPWQPEQDCKRIEPGVTGEMPVFLKAPDGRWECTVLVVLGPQERRSSLFVQIRGAADGLTDLRMKLNFAQEDGEDDALADRAAALGRRLLAPLEADRIRYMKEKMAARQEFRTELAGFEATFRREAGGVPRFNFIARSSRPESGPTEDEGPNKTAPDAAAN